MAGSYVGVFTFFFFVRAASATYTTAHGNARSLTH